MKAKKEVEFTGNEQLVDAMDMCYIGFDKSEKIVRLLESLQVESIEFLNYISSAHFLWLVMNPIKGRKYIVSSWQESDTDKVYISIYNTLNSCYSRNYYIDAMQTKKYTIEKSSPLYSRLCTAIKKLEDKYDQLPFNMIEDYIYSANLDKMDFPDENN